MRCVNLKHHMLTMFSLVFVLVAYGPSAAHAQALKTSENASLSQLQGVTDDSLNEADPRQFVDGIAAVVNKNVITLRQLNQETNVAKINLQQQGIPVPDTTTLQKQVLQRMIMQELELQEANNRNIAVGEEDLQYALRSIAERNGISQEQMRKEIVASGMDWDVFIEDLKKEIKLDILRQSMVENTIFISDAEVDSFLKNEGRQMALGAISAPRQAAPQAAAQQPAELIVKGSGQYLGMRHILVAVPEGSTSSKIEELRQKAESLLSQVRGGADFSGVAAASSDGPNALDGGDMGVRPTEGWPDLFIESVKGLKEGQASNVFKSGNGFHILQVALIDDPNAAPVQAPRPAQAAQQAPQADFSDNQTVMPQGSTIVTQTKARHILVKTSKVVSDEQAEQRLLQLKQRVEHGEDFAELAKNHSEDSNAPLGGELGWLSPGETVPAFENAMDRLEPGQISGPVQSQFGWHLIQVQDRRSKDMEDEFKRMQARQILFQRQVEPAMEDWLNLLRGEAYIENRIDPQDNRSRRR